MKLTILPVTYFEATYITMDNRAAFTAILLLLLLLYCLHNPPKQVATVAQEMMQWFLECNREQEIYDWHGKDWNNLCLYYASQGMFKDFGLHVINTFQVNLNLGLWAWTATQMFSTETHRLQPPDSFVCDTGQIVCPPARPKMFSYAMVPFTNQQHISPYPDVSLRVAS